MKTPPFDQRIAATVDDAHLHQAIGKAASALRERRGAALEALPDVERVRDEARAARLAQIPRLEALAREFTAAVEPRGVRVHRAPTATDAVRIVRDIAQAAGVQRVVKAKSMATEEIHLNAGLIEAGLDVRETDLGEYIVQLAEDRPSHIILPIVHMDRGDVGRVMERTLEVPFTDDPEQLAAIARRRLRADFLAADMGVSGANFAAAREGLIVLVSNEGNIRMVTSLPRVHVAVVGIDKLVPTLADAERLLRLLPRSATGQKSTVYTSIVRGPRVGPDDEGPDEVHVVLLDSGRSAIAEGPQSEILACIRCGACLNACPVYRRIGGHAYGGTYPGPLGSVFHGALPGDDYEDLVSACSLCGACEEICPVRIDLPGMHRQLRARTVQRGRAPRRKRWAMRAFAVLATRPRLFRLARRIGGWWLRRRARGGWLSDGPGAIGRWTVARDLPAPPAESFADRWRKRQRS